MDTAASRCRRLDPEARKRGASASFLSSHRNWRTGLQLIEKASVSAWSTWKAGGKMGWRRRVFHVSTVYVRPAGGYRRYVEKAGRTPKPQWPFSPLYHRFPAKIAAHFYAATVPPHPLPRFSPYLQAWLRRTRVHFRPASRSSHQRPPSLPLPHPCPFCPRPVNVGALFYAPSLESRRVSALTM